MGWNYVFCVFYASLKCNVKSLEISTTDSRKWRYRYKVILGTMCSFHAYRWRFCGWHIIYWNHTNSRVLNEELYVHTVQKVFLLHLFTDLFRKDFTMLSILDNWLQVESLKISWFKYGMVISCVDENNCVKRKITRVDNRESSTGH